MRVLLADDHQLVRAGIRALLSENREVTEIFEARDGREALEKVIEHRPDLVLMDITMPGMNGLEALEQIRTIAPQTAVVILSMHRDAHFVRRAMRGGASGYLLKSDAVTDLQEALRAVRNGQTYLSPSVASSVQAKTSGDGSSVQRLTPRQREVLELVARGLTSREIAQHLQIHIKTVESHRMELMRRLGIHDVAGLVRYAIRHGLAPAE